MSIKINDEEYLYLNEVLEKLDTNMSYLYAGIKAGLVPAPKKIEVRKVWKKTDIEEYLKNRTDKGITDKVGG